MGSESSLLFSPPVSYLRRGDGMNGVFCALMLAGLLYAAATGRPDAAQRALLSGGGEAVGLLMRLAGAYAFFGGLLGVLRESGAADALARAMEKPLSRLFRFALGRRRRWATSA